MKSEVTIAGDRLQITRVFRAPRAEVFTWWAEAEKLQRWSGCKEAAACEITMDFRPGGSFTQKMQIAVQGKTCAFTLTGTYEEIAAPERIAYRANVGAAVLQVVVEFFDVGEGTKVVLTQTGLPDSFTCNTISQGTQESLDKLDGILSADYQPAGAVLR